MRAIAVPGSLGLVVVLTASCNFGKALRPEPASTETAMSAQDQQCAKDGGASVPEVGKPLAVDLQAAQRGDMEIAMRQSLLVAAYDCKGLRILDDCHVEGSYGYLGFLPKEELVRLNDADEVGANLPISAGAFGAKLGADFARGATVDVALMMVGKSTAPMRVVSRAQLVEDRPGSCDGATHFVRGVTHGAFAIATGSKTNVRGAAEVFGIPSLGTVGAHGGNESSKDVSRKDGDLAACKGASRSAQSPPDACAAILRLELSLIDPSGAPRVGTQVELAPATPVKQGEAAPEANAESCPPGLVYAGGKCTRTADGAPHLCKREDPADCKAQCDAGHGPSCGRLGYYAQEGLNGVPKDAAKAAALYEKGCNQGSAPVACASLAVLYSLGEGVPKDLGKAQALGTQACDGGFEEGCFFVGTGLLYGKAMKKDPAGSVPFLTRACNGGLPKACSVLAITAQKGFGQPKNEKLALELLTRSCAGSDALGCFGVADAYAYGVGVAVDRPKALAYYKMSCELGIQQACGVTFKASGK